jgi:hypothetical protein
MAAGSAVVLLATGIYTSGRHVESLSTVPRSTYGIAVVAKILLVVIALSIAAYNTLVVNGHLADRVGQVLGHTSGWRPRRHRLATTVTVEAGVLAVAVVAATLMTSVPTAREVAAATRVPAMHSESVNGLFVTFEAVPTGAALRLVVRTQPVVRPEVAPVSGVEVGISAGSSTARTIAGGERIPLAAVEAGHFEATTTMLGASSWTAEVVVHRTGRPDAVLLVPGTTTADDAPTPLEPTATALSALLLAGLATAITVLLRRRAADAPSGSGAARGPIHRGGAPEAQEVPVSRLDTRVGPSVMSGAEVGAEPTPFEEVGRR